MTKKIILLYIDESKNTSLSLFLIDEVLGMGVSDCYSDRGRKAIIEGIVIGYYCSSPFFVAHHVKPKSSTPKK